MDITENLSTENAEIIGGWTVEFFSDVGHFRSMIRLMVEPELISAADLPENTAAAHSKQNNGEPATKIERSQENK